MARTPPLHLLRSFIRAALTESFSRAADELNLTQSAVSQHIRQLEEQVGTALFERSHRKVSLTELGKIYLHLVSGPITALEEGQAMIQAMTSVNSLLVKTSRTFSTRWLLPRLPALTRNHPDLDISLLMLNSALPMDGHTGDCVIARVDGEPKRAGFRVERVVRSVLTPICSPEIAGKVDLDRLDEASVIHTLIRHNDWQVWCRHARVPFPHLNRGWTFENSLMSYQAAEQGLGVVMAELFMVQSELESGKLVRLSPIEVELDRGYYLLTPENRMEKKAVRAFREWLLDGPHRLSGAVETRIAATPAKA